MKSKSAPDHMTTFAITWFGQLVSVIGSGLTGFGLGVWVFENTGSVTYFALIGLATVLPRVILSPLIGPLIDRWDRRRAMILGDTGAGVSTLLIALLLLTGRLQMWHIYLLTGVSAAFSTIQWPAYMAATSLLVPQARLGRANGMVQFGQAASEILAPALAGSLLLSIGLQGLLLIDFVTFLFAVATLLWVRFPRPASDQEQISGHGSWWQEIGYGWRYIVARPGLTGLLAFSAAVHFLWGMVGALITPMILGFTTSRVLGMIVSVAGLGMLTGSLLMSLWGGPVRRINAIIGFELFSGLCFVLIGMRAAVWPIALGVFGAHLTIAVVFGNNQAIWQSKVAPQVQGRVFATQQTIARAAAPLAYLLAGPLAERLFEPLLAAGGGLSAGLGPVLGTGTGRGIGLMFVLMGAAKVAVSLAAWFSPRVRYVEDELPDITMPDAVPCQM